MVKNEMYVKKMKFSRKMVNKNVAKKRSMNFFNQHNCVKNV